MRLNLLRQSRIENEVFALKSQCKRFVSVVPSRLLPFLTLQVFSCHPFAYFVANGGLDEA